MNNLDGFVRRPDVPERDYFSISKEFFDNHAPDLGGVGICVLSALIRNADPVTGFCHLSTRLIAAHLGCSAGHVLQTLDKLRAMGLYVDHRVTLFAGGLCGNTNATGLACWYCGAVDVLLQIEHQSPKSRFAESRIVAACGSCNSAKGVRTLEEYRAMFTDGHAFFGECQ